LFERPHHRRIAQVLQALDGDVLRAQGCLFGGGTAIALKFGEYRESVDIDLLVSRLDGYRTLRQSLGGVAGLGPITRAGHALTLAREVRADQYGIRTLVQVDDGIADPRPIKFEIVHEARIALDTPPDDAAARICGITPLSDLDLAATKLLANADRWRDDAVFSRDLIDLAMMAPPPALLRQAVAKASSAYGDAIARDLLAAIDALRQRAGRLEVCRQALQITLPKAAVWGRIRRLRLAL
jgi:Nucleotidyl transferase AbiEii toxin, Type IV TA system